MPKKTAKRWKGRGLFEPVALTDEQMQACLSSDLPIMSMLLGEDPYAEVERRWPGLAEKRVPVKPGDPHVLVTWPMSLIQDPDGEDRARVMFHAHYAPAWTKEYCSRWFEDVVECRGCGCDDNHGCMTESGRRCHWVEDDLCSECAE